VTYVSFDKAAHKETVWKLNKFELKIKSSLIFWGSNVKLLLIC